MTDDEMLEAYNTAVDAAMDRAYERDGFASNTSRESRVAGLRAIERAAAARALEEAADAWDEGYQEANSDLWREGGREGNPYRAEACRQEREEQ